MNKKVLFVVSAFVVSVLISFQLTFANQDMTGMLEQWFDRKETDALHRIDSAIATQSELEKLRLHTAIAEKLQLAEEELVQYEADEIKRVTYVLRQHTDALIASIDFTDEEERKRYTAILEEMIERAIEEINKVERPSEKDKEETHEVDAEEENDPIEEQESNEEDEVGELDED